MRFGVLGRLQVEDNGGAGIAINAARQRTLLAALLLNANQIVPSDTLAEIIWDGAPPSGAANTVRAYVMRLRKALGPDIAARIETREPGYLARLEPGELDLALFDALSEATDDDVRAGDRWREASAGAARALALWRDAPLVDVPSRQLRDAWLPRLEQQRIQLLEWRIEADLELGRAAVLVPELEALVAAHPYRESLYRLLMLALARTGRNGEALGVFRQARTTLIEGLGIEPGAELQKLHQDLLRGTRPEEVAAPDPGGSRTRPGRPVPRQLPVDVRSFVGRVTEQAALTSMIEAAVDAESCETVVISAIDGMGGVGKSALAVHVAHRLAARFPDGQLFVDLRGHTAGVSALAPGEALGQLLSGLGVPPAQIPGTLAEQAALFRSELAGTRTLILIDNAASAAQVLPLLPAAGRCLTLVTSRGRLPALDDAHFISLDVLPPADAGTLLLNLAGPGRLDPRSPAVSELVELCAGLPLVVRIAASHLRYRRALTIEDYVRQLRGAANRLEHLRDEDRNLTAVFDTSFADLRPDEQWCFRALSLIPGPDFDAFAAANLLGGEHRAAERLLESMLTQNLLVQRSPGRYEFHDLVRAYAQQLIEPSAPASVACWERLLDYYQRGAGIGELLLNERGYAQTRTRPHEKLTALIPELTARAASTAWFRTELSNIAAAAADAARRGRHERVVDLAAASQVLLMSVGHATITARFHADAVASARELRDQRILAERLIALGRVREDHSELAAVADLLTEALEAARAAGDRRLEANVLSHLGRTTHKSGDLGHAAELYDLAVQIHREQGDGKSEATALALQGRLKLASGEPAAAARVLRRALSLHRESGNRLGESSVAIELAQVELHLGDCAVAAQLLDDSLKVLREYDYPYNEGIALWFLASVRRTTGELEEARTLCEQSAAMFETAGDVSMCAWVRWELGKVELASGEPGAAAAILQSALAVFRSADTRYGMAHVLCELGRARHRLGTPATAALYLARSLEIFREIGAPLELAQALNARGSFDAYRGDATEAERLHLEALGLARGCGSPLEEAHALAGLSTCHALLGRYDEADTALTHALTLYERIGARERSEVSSRLAELKAGRPPGT